MHIRLKGRLRVCDARGTHGLDDLGFVTSVGLIESGSLSLCHLQPFPERLDGLPEVQGSGLQLDSTVLHLGGWVRERLDLVAWMNKG